MNLPVIRLNGKIESLEGEPVLGLGAAISYWKRRSGQCRSSCPGALQNELPGSCELKGSIRFPTCSGV